MKEDEYWPFPVTDEDRQWPEMLEKIAFLEAAASANFKGYRTGLNGYGAESATRDGIILERGRKRWEIRLSETGIRQFSAFVTEFPIAGSALVSWLKGATVDGILEDVKDDLVVPPGAASSYTISGMTD